jgi:triphosphoribosyl-dephospho-CoA synthase
VTQLEAAIAAAFQAACRDELEAPKPGNVHVFASGHRMTESDFVRSADAAAAPLAQPRARVGARIQAAVEATLAAVGANTNLGIILLCAPLAAAAESAAATPTDIRTAVTGVLASLDLEDANLAFAGIRRASPAGLGRVARHDVFLPATVTLRDAMAAAADRDRIACQYATAFEDVFALGEPSLTSMLPRMPHRRWATLAVYLGFLAAFPDTHIVRKHGIKVAQDTQRTAAAFRARLQSAHTPDDLLADLLAWDAALKNDGINPGTSADLTVATLFAHRLRGILPLERISG